MAAYTLRRVWQMVPTLLGVVLLVFILFHFFGADPSVILAGQNATQAQIAAIRQELGLDQPLYVQFWIYLKSIVTFDWGRSWATADPATNARATAMPIRKLPITMAMLLFSFLRAPSRNGRYDPHLGNCWKKL